MTAKRLLLIAATLFFALALAQGEMGGPVTVTVMESEEYGPYLTDADGRSLYLFVNEEMEMGEEAMSEGVRENAVPCTGGCLQAWPPLTASEVTAGEGVNADLLYTAEVDGTTMVVYNGWPLYYFASDTEPGQTNGQGRGSAPNVWYLVTPEGMPLEPEE